MAGATFYWAQGVGAATGSPAAPTTWIPTLSSGIPSSTSFNNADFMSIDGWNWTGQGGYVNYAAYPISVLTGATNYSYEKWLRAYFEFAVGVTNTINNCHFYRGNSSGMNDETLSVFAKDQTTYLTPQGGSKRSGGSGNYKILYYDGEWLGPVSANSASSTSDLLGLADDNTRIGLWNGTTGGNYSITSSNWTDWIVLQLEVPEGVSTPGNIGTLTWKFSYDES